VEGAAQPGRTRRTPAHAAIRAGADEPDRVPPVFGLAVPELLIFLALIALVAWLLTRRKAN
jgi:hypothetical protein